MELGNPQSETHFMEMEKESGNKTKIDFYLGLGDETHSEESYVPTVDSGAVHNGGGNVLWRRPITKNCIHLKSNRCSHQVPLRHLGKERAVSPFHSG